MVGSLLNHWLDDGVAGTIVSHFAIAFDHRLASHAGSDSEGRGRMARRIFVNLPVTDVARSTAFHTALGFVRDAAFSNDRAAAMTWSDTIHVMLLGHGFHARFTPKPIGAGGREAHPPEDHGFMYSRAFEDPDGHGFGPFWMDMAAAPPADTGIGGERVA